MREEKLAIPVKYVKSYTWNSTWMPGIPKIHSKPARGINSPPKEVCLKCIGTIYSDCLHKSLPDYQQYLCNIGKRHFIICKCRKHENAHDWMRVNYDPKKGKRNIDIMNKEIGANHIQINSIRANESSQSQQ